ncbi:GTPase HflX [soil metagenome]
MSEINSVASVRAILVGAGENRYLDELSRLADTLGLTVVDSLEQNRRDGAGYVGKGKREELADLVQICDAELVVTDDELTASQARTLARASGASVVDRTELIIRIFEAHARDAASRLEVELADLEYRLPRVKGRNPALSRLGGGVGGGRVTRGPGEQQLEYDRRAIRRRIEAINRKLSDEKRARQVRGARLNSDGPPVVALVGYTNAGKTTMLNSLSGTHRSTADRLFETLETTTRRVSSPGNEQGSSAKPQYVVTDTVGFIRKLPTQLVHSFASTLEAAHNADLVVFCADASSDSVDDEISTATTILATRQDADSVAATNGSFSGKSILCLNKIDLLTPTELAALKRKYPAAVFVSARSNTEELSEAIYDAVLSDRERIQLLIPHDEYGLANGLYGNAEIHASKDTVEGLWLDVSLSEAARGQYEPYRLS